MADSYTVIANLINMETNSHDNDWGTQLNANFTLIDRAIGLKAGSISSTGGTVSRVQDDLVEPIQRITGALTSNLIIEVPASLQRSNIYINDTTGNFTVTVKVTGQTGVAIARGDTKWLRCNGTDTVDIGIPTYSQLAGIAEWLGSASGTNTYTVAANEYIDGLADGLEITCYIANANSSATVTLNFNSTGAKTVVHSDGSAMAIGDIPAGSLKTFTYRLSSDKWFMNAPSASVLAKLSGTNTWTGAQTFSGIVTMSAGFIQAPSSLTDAATIAWNMAVTTPNVTTTLTASRAMGAPSNVNVGQFGFMEYIQPVAGNCQVTFHANFDPMGTPSVGLNASETTIFGYFAKGASAIKMWPVYKSGHNSIGFWKEYDMGTLTLGAEDTQAHGLGAYPALVQVYLECTTIDIGHSVGDRLLVGGDMKDNDNNRGIEVGYNTTEVFVRVGATEPLLLDTSGVRAALTASRWKLIARVYN